MSASGASGAYQCALAPGDDIINARLPLSFFLIINNYTYYKTHDTPYLRMYIIVQTKISGSIYFFNPLLFLTKTCCDDAIVRGAFKGTEEQ